MSIITELNLTFRSAFYHGTNAVFDSFDSSFKGTNTGWQNTIHGFFFADKKENALLFGSNLIIAQLEIRNPIDLRLHSIFSNESQASLIWEILTGHQLSPTLALKTIYKEISLGEIEELYDVLHSVDAHEIMVQSGYDSIISDLGDGNIEYAVFNPSQIKILEFQQSFNHSTLKR